MSHPLDENEVGNEIGQKQDRLLTTLERLLEIQATEVRTTLSQVTQLVAQALEADKVDIFFHDRDVDTLVALGTSNTPMGRRQRAIGMDRLPIVNLGRTVEAFLTGQSYFTGHADEDPSELVGIKEGLGVVSVIVTAFAVDNERRGVLLVSSGKPDFFSEQDLRFIEAVARWVGAVVNRAELVEFMTQEAAEQGRRMAAEELLTIMAHDVRNYLTPIRGHLDLIERRARRENREQDVLNATRATAALSRLNGLISNLLDIARLNQGIFSINPQPLNLVDLVQEVAAAFRTVETLIQIQAPQEVVISADPDRLHQLLENLLANAVQHTPKKTPVEVSVDTERRDDGIWAVLIVANQGPSIPPDLLSHLFQPFISGSSSRGLGLGLYLASRIAGVHNGTLTVDSAPGEGTRFTLSLPADIVPETANGQVGNAEPG
jgi:two-component system, OmpR family, sensor kinase